jgi:multidrug resistance efflux pump
MNNVAQHVDVVNDASPYMKQVLSTPPKWIIRYGEIYIFIFVAIVFLLSYFIKYSDKIPAKATITTHHPPIEIVSRSNGPIAKLLIHEHDTVEKGQILAIIQNNAQYKDVMTLKNHITNYYLDNHNIESEKWNEGPYSLGDMQQLYGLLLHNIQQYKLYIQNIPAYKEQQALYRQIENYRALLLQKADHIALVRRKIELAEKDFNRNELLYSSGSISQKALEESENQLLETKENYQALKSDELRIGLEISSLEREAQKLSIKHSTEGRELLTATLASMGNLHSAISSWEDKYLIRAPQQGIVSFSQFWTEQQYLEPGQHVFSIVPDTLVLGQQQSIIAQLRVPVRNSGKLAPGQKVCVHLENYPSDEFGAIYGVVQNISPLPKLGHYHVEVSFPSGLLTQYGKQIPFQHHLLGKAEIITEELSILERIFYTFKGALSNT